MTYAEWCLENIGYETKTTFFDDFSIADKFGAASIKDTYKRALKEWGSDKVYLTELVMVLNHKCWFMYDHGKEALSELYADLYDKAHEYALSHLKGDDLSYFLETTD